MKNFLFLIFLFAITNMFGQECAFELLDNASLKNFYSESSSRCSDECLDVCALPEHYQIPVAFHVINGPAESEAWPSESVIEFFLEVANEILGDHINLVRADDFYPCVDFYNNPTEEFATITPEGLNGANEIEIYSKSRYNPEEILNIYFVQRILVDGNSSSFTGFSRSPLSPSWSLDVDGIVLAKRPFSADTSPSKGQVLAHELGHYLNLIHIWGPNNHSDENCHDLSESCFKGDLIPDTEPCRGSLVRDFSSDEHLSLDCITNSNLWEEEFEGAGDNPFCGQEMKYDCRNIMGFAHKGRNVRDEVSDGQFNRMIAAINDFRSELIPSELDPFITDISSNQAKLVWNEMVNSMGYTVRIRKASENNFSEHFIDDEQTTSFIFENLEFDTEYVVQLDLGCGLTYELNFKTTCPSQTACDPCSQTQDLEINHDQTLTVSEIRGNVIINSGVTLTVNTQVEFAENSGILVKRGGKLILDGGVLTNCDIYPKWNGVHLEGHLDLGLSNSSAGTIVMRNSSSIMNAEIGIDLRNYYSDFFTIEYGGGIVDMGSNSSIKNCDKGIYFAAYGWGAITGSGTPELSIINNSVFENCKEGIHLESNIGLEVNGTIFFSNSYDIISEHSSFDLQGNTFNSGIVLFSEYPNFQGANIIENNFIDVGLQVHSMGNVEPLNFTGNSCFGTSFSIFGDLDFVAFNNTFYDSGTGVSAWESGDNQFNLVVDNAFYNNNYGTSSYGVNNIEYLTNCFENTNYYDMEIYSGASIHESQGNPTLSESAGNCFDHYARIGTGSGSEHFDYWTKDGFATTSASCKFPGSGNFTRRLAQTELSNDNCGASTNYTSNIPSRYRDCECVFGDNQCKKTIKAIEAEIMHLENDTSINHWVRRWLIAKYKRCLDRLKKTLVRGLLNEGRIEEAIDFLSIQDAFRLRILAYGIMMNNHEINRAKSYLSSLYVNSSGESDFVFVQNLFLDYKLANRNYTLNNVDRAALALAANAKNPYSGYARSIYYRLTGEIIEIELPHIDKEQILPRGTNANNSDVEIFPNPVYTNEVYLDISDFDNKAVYKLRISSIDGRLIVESVVNEATSTFNLKEEVGVFILQLVKNDEEIKSEKLVRL